MEPGWARGAPPALERMLKERYGRSTKRWFFFKKTMRFAETVIEEGDVLFVAGDVKPTPGGNWQFAKGRWAFLVTDEQEDALLRSYSRWAIGGWALVAGGLVVAGLLLRVFLQQGP